MINPPALSPDIDMAATAAAQPSEDPAEPWLYITMDDQGRISIDGVPVDDITTYLQARDVDAPRIMLSVAPDAPFEASYRFGAELAALGLTPKFNIQSKGESQ
ncbi:hypothetical protein [Litorimonas sp. WD9-15]|uniref:hypothetical protein n=1 Tax=Litorimonas sp. WD9-15 TaxID=3418716 RepID=UPI003CFDB17C